MDLKDKLSAYHNEITRYEKVTYIASDDKAKKKGVRTKKSKLFIDASYLRAIMASVGGAAKTIAFTILDETNFGTNLFNGTYEEIEEMTGLSRGSVISGMNDLLSADFIRRVKNGRWMLNPSVGTKCFEEDIVKLTDLYFTYKRKDPKGDKEDDINRQST